MHFCHTFFNALFYISKHLTHNTDDTHLRYIHTNLHSRISLIVKYNWIIFFIHTFIRLCKLCGYAIMRLTKRRHSTPTVPFHGLISTRDDFHTATRDPSNHSRLDSWSPDLSVDELLCPSAIEINYRTQQIQYDATRCEQKQFPIHCSLPTV